ncbi:MAG: adenine deaminase [Synergistaceae bacterium]|jgi:adenine deaminase|nr:adenine deaminase [Synergistaceae bacterium]
MKDLLAVARGEKPADFVVKGARVANVFTLEYEDADVAVYGEKIAGVGKGYEGRSVVDGKGKVLIPGMIDGHVHIESSMLVPEVFADQVALHGTTAVMSDPHEIANVLGMRGVEYMYMASRGLPVDVFLGAPSCVPASEFETPFEGLEMDRIREMFRRGWCQHLGEVMNFPGVIGGDDAIWGKIQAAGDVPLTGHAPGVSGSGLCAYIAGGISSDHESSRPEEGLEKLRRGMWLMMREGSSTHDLGRLLPLVLERPQLSSRCMVVSDDVSAQDLLKGHMDEKIRIMAGNGLDPLVALRMVTLSPAEYFGLKDRGAIGPGRLADMALVKDLETCEIEKVWKNGQLTVDGGRRCSSEENSRRESVLFIKPATVKAPTLSQLAIPFPHGAELNVIGLNEGLLSTRKLTLRPSIRDGLAVADAKRDIAKIVVQNRHRETEHFALGFVCGLGLTKGAIASSVAHDAHNFIAVGMDDLSIATALAQMGENGGGLVAAEGSTVTGYFPLPVAGLMTTLDVATAARGLREVEKRACALGMEVPHPFMVLSFLSLSVIPELRITDKGYVDITKGGIQPIFSFVEFR